MRISINLKSTLIATATAVLTSSFAAQAVETQSQWYEQQRALTDGSVQVERLAPPRGTAAGEQGDGRTDSWIIQQLRMSDGYRSPPAARPSVAAMEDCYRAHASWMEKAALRTPQACWRAHGHLMVAR